ncbi:MAG: serine protease [Gammaproteobacteria bacterium]|jgi:V8-like Glu-specific endopeptidase
MFIFNWVKENIFGKEENKKDKKKKEKKKKEKKKKEDKTIQKINTSQLKEVTEKQNNNFDTMGFFLKGKGEVSSDQNLVSFKVEKESNIKVMFSKGDRHFLLYIANNVFYICNQQGYKLASFSNNSIATQISITKDRVQKYFEEFSNQHKLPMLKSRCKKKSVYDRSDYPFFEIYETSYEFQQLARSVGALIPKVCLQQLNNGKYKIKSNVYKLQDNYKGLDDNYVFKGQKVPAFGTAFFGSKNCIITAGHCIITDEQKAFYYKKVYFVVGFVQNQDGTTCEIFPKKDVYTLKRIVERKCEYVQRDEDDPPWDKDWAVVELNKETDRKVLKRSTNLPKKNTALCVIGHPCGLPMKVDQGGRVKKEMNDESNPYRFFANTNTFGGNSGSPVINQVTLEVEGILISGNEDFLESLGSFGKDYVQTYPDSHANESCTVIKNIEHCFQ